MKYSADIKFKEISPSKGAVFHFQLIFVKCWVVFYFILRNKALSRCTMGHLYTRYPGMKNVGPKVGLGLKRHFLPRSEL